MIPNKEYILQLLNKNRWSQNKFAQKAHVSKTTISRWLKGSRGAGKQLISGIIMAFPNEPIDKLFFCPMRHRMVTAGLLAGARNSEWLRGMPYDSDSCPCQ